MSSDDPRTVGEGRLEDDNLAAVVAFRAAAVRPHLSVFHTAREARRLEAALDAANVRPSWAGRVAQVAAFTGAGTAFVAVGFFTARAADDVFLSPSPPANVAVAPLPEHLEPRFEAPRSDEPRVDDEGAQPAFVAVPPVPDPFDDVAAPLPARRQPIDELLALAPVESPPVVPPTVVPLADWRVELRRLVDGGDGDAAARVLVMALRTDLTAAAELRLLARQFPSSFDAIDAELAQLQAAEVMRVRCEQRLLRARDRTAVEACRAFGQQHPSHPAARIMSFAAGRAAEDLGELRWAEEEYSRSLLLSPFAGLPGTDALLARARVRAALGDVDEARADLRLYLHSAHGERADPEVVRLVEELELD